MKNIKQQFITAVQILAPENEFILKLALRIPEEQLPAYPGGAALEFVAALEKLTSSPTECSDSPWLRPVSPPARRRCPGGRPYSRPAGRHSTSVASVVPSSVHKSIHPTIN